MKTLVTKQKKWERGRSRREQREKGEREEFEQRIARLSGRPHYFVSPWQHLFWWQQVPCEPDRTGRSAVVRTLEIRNLLHTSDFSTGNSLVHLLPYYARKEFVCARLVFLVLFALGAGKLTTQQLQTHMTWRSLVVCSGILYLVSPQQLRLSRAQSTST
jgi:hypothetical protein